MCDLLAEIIPTLDRRQRQYRCTTDGPTSSPQMTMSLLKDLKAGRSGRYAFQGRLLQVSRVIMKCEAVHPMTEGSSLHDAREKDRRLLYSVSEDNIPFDSPLFLQLSSSEIKPPESSARQRQTLIRIKSTLHSSLIRPWCVSYLAA